MHCDRFINFTRLKAASCGRIIQYRVDNSQPNTEIVKCRNAVPRIDWGSAIRSLFCGLLSRPGHVRARRACDPTPSIDSITVSRHGIGEARHLSNSATLQLAATRDLTDRIGLMQI